MSQDPLPYATRTDPPRRPGPGQTAFGVIVRTIGLLVALYAVSILIEPFQQIIGMRSKSSLMPRTLSEGIIVLAIGVCLIRGRWLVDLAYSRRED